MIRLGSPRSQLWLLRGDCEQQWSLLEGRTLEHPFNHAVELVVPGVLQPPPQLSPSPPHYYTSSSALPLSHLVQPEVTRRYLLDGSLAALSRDTHIDTDNVFAVLPSGKLLLSVNKDTHEQLGLQGKPSHFQRHCRFAVEVDLAAACFKPGKPNYERVKWCLTDRLGLEAPFVISWWPKDLPTASEHQLLEDFRAKRRECAVEKELLHSFLLPSASWEHPLGHSEDGHLLHCSAAELHTWLGAVACGADMEGSPGDYVSAFAPPEPHSMCHYGTRTKWTGMVHSRFVSNILEGIRDYLSTSPGPPWVAVNVWGFEDSPISWRTCEHGWHLSGDNHYTAVLFDTGQFWFISSLGTHDLLQ